LAGLQRLINAPVAARVLALGKDGNAYLLNRENLGGVGHQIAVTHVSTSEIITAMATYPGAGAAMVAFEGEGAHCPSGSGNLVMLKITPSAVATVWCAAFNGFGAPIVTTTDGKSNPIVWVAGAAGDGKLYGFRGTDGKSNPIVWVAGAAGDGKLYGFRGTDGKLLAAVVGGGAPIQSYQTILSANGRLYVAAQRDLCLRVLGPQAAQRLKRSASNGIGRRACLTAILPARPNVFSRLGPRLVPRSMARALAKSGETSQYIITYTICYIAATPSNSKLLERNSLSLHHNLGRRRSFGIPSG
jgi:hypothetical protein